MQMIMKRLTKDDCHRTMSIFPFRMLWLLILSATMVTSQTTTAASNYQCINSTVIPSRNITTLKPYIHTTQLSKIFDPNPPNITCPKTDWAYYEPPRSQVRSIWYQWTPTTSGYYDFEVTIPSISHRWWFSIIEGTSCLNLRKPIGCRLTSARGVYLNAKTNYYISIIFITNSFGDNVTLAVSPTILRPVNDDCQNAIAIPSSVKLPYTITTNSLITNATIQPNERIPSCDRLVFYGNFLNTLPTNTLVREYKNNFGGHSIWYSYIPPSTGYYNFTTLGTISEPYGFLTEPRDAPITIGVYEAIGFGNNTNNTRVCSNMTNHFTEVYCSRNIFNAIDRNEKLKSGKQYYIQLVPDMYNRFVLTNVVLTIDRAPVPAINDKCSGAIAIDPITGINKVFNATTAVSDALHFPNGLGCSESEDPLNLLRPAVWYKYVHTGGGITEIVHELCQFRRGNLYYILTGNDCNNLKCFAGFSSTCSFPSITFTLEQPTTYWFLLTVDKYDAFANFTVSFRRRNNFRLIDAGSDTTIGPILSDAVYSYGPSSATKLTTTELNIEANFQSLLNVQSTRITYTNPNFTRCETTKPFSVFGDLNGNYRPGFITIGTHSITAIPYSQPKCQGTPIPGATLSEKLTMQGCRVEYFFHGLFVGRIELGAKVPCSAILGGFIDCNFPARNITIDLYNADTNTSIIGDTVIAPQISTDIYYFGTLNANAMYGVSPINLLPSSKYVMTLTINRIRHASKTFAIQNACVP